MESIKRVNVEGKKVIVRVDFNVPIKDGKITDDTRIVSSLKTIKYLVTHNAKVILLSHLGRVASQEDKEKKSLEIVAKHLSTLINVPIYFVPVTRGDLLTKTVESMENGEIVVAMNDDNEVTLKTFYKEKKFFRLQPENDLMLPIILKKVTILGKAIGLYRKF